MIYQIAEKFKSVQGEGVYAGTPMAFIRFVGCSVGKKICSHCDTIFEKTLPWQGGGEFTDSELFAWVTNAYRHVCFTGGEPLDQPELVLLAEKFRCNGQMVHIETSGTKEIPYELCVNDAAIDRGARADVWICVSPKPGFLEKVVAAADEVKVIVPGLGEITSAQVDAHIIKLHQPGYQCGPGEFEDYAKKLRWPNLEDALRWAAAGKTVFLQPRNGRFDIDKQNLLYCQDLVREYPQLRLSVQLHKILKVQ